MKHDPELMEQLAVEREAERIVAAKAVLAAVTPAIQPEVEGWQDELYPWKKARGVLAHVRPGVPAEVHMREVRDVRREIDFDDEFSSIVLTYEISITGNSDGSGTYFESFWLATGNDHIHPMEGRGEGVWEALADLKQKSEQVYGK